MQKHELIFRGAVDVIVRDDLIKKLNSKKKLIIKFGIDPTADRVHIGRAATLRHLKHFQDEGHQIHIVIGSFTGQIGDSSDKEVERKMLTSQEIEENMTDYRKHFEKIFDISSAIVHYNGDWFGNMSLVEFFKLQQMFSVSQMIERENFAKRYKNNKRIGLHEFSYALLQGYDSVAIKADIEIGGTDQLFNLLAGRVVQKNYNLPQQNVITYELLLGLDGRKMSTTWKNCIYVDDRPDDMFGKVMSINDSLMWDYFRLTTELDSDELEEIKNHLENKHDPRGLKARLAYEITKMYHGQSSAEKASHEFERRFVGRELPSEVSEISAKTGTRNIIELIVQLDLSSSKSAARRLLKSGAVKINQEKIQDETIFIEAGDIISVGKHRHVKITN